MSAPEWFDWAVRQPRLSHFADSAGARVHYMSWNAGEQHKPCLLLVHGFLGQSHWWDFIAPFLTEKHRVFAMDFSGMGESDHRAHYSPEVFNEDMAAVLRATSAGPAVVVAHSFGGSRLLQACSTMPELFSHAIVLDSYVQMEGEEQPRANRRPAPRPYPDEATALAKFRLLPEQPCEPWLLDYLARHSLRQADDGWVWSFDPALRHLQPAVGIRDTLRKLLVPVTYVHAESSNVVSSERARSIVEGIPGARGPITLPRTCHHMMLDQPLALISVLRALLA